MSEVKDQGTQTSDKTPSWSEAYKAVRGPIRDVQTAHDEATIDKPAPVEIAGQNYQVSRDSAGRSIKPIGEASEKPQKP